MGSLVLVPAERSHIEPMAAGMREVDRQEIWLSDHKRPEEALARAFEYPGWTCTALANDRPAAMFGLSYSVVLSARACPWMLATNFMDRRPADLLRFGRSVVGEMRRGVKLLENWVWADNIKSIRWLKWLGFQVEEAKPWGAEDASFHRFWMKGELCAA